VIYFPQNLTDKGFEPHTPSAQTIFLECPVVKEANVWVEDEEPSTRTVKENQYCFSIIHCGIQLHTSRVFNKYNCAI